MDALQDWGNNGLEALKLRLVRSKSDSSALEEEEAVLVADFEPSFVYPIFGQEETIFGYTSLEIQLRFASGSLKQYLHVAYDSKYPETAAVQADDPEKILFEFIPPSYAKALDSFEKTVEEDAKEFVPLGNKVASYRLKDEEDEAQSAKAKGKGKGKQGSEKVFPERNWIMLGEKEEEEDEVEVVYEAYATTWATPGFKEFHRRMQIFVLLYIEGAQYIDEDDTRWEFITLFERRRNPASKNGFSYHFVGFTSFYSFFCWPDTKRLRLAQFVILPPYQGQAALYTLSYRNILQRSEISELTVEDPSETFEDMRDKCDLYTLLSSGDLDQLRVPFERASTELIRKKHKLADRQFYRLVEMILLLNLDPSNKIAATAVRLTVKRRLFSFNREQLSQIDIKERKEKLQETYLSVVQDYERLIAGFK